MESVDYHAALSALSWQIELGADECISDAPVNRYEVPAPAPKSVVTPARAAPPAPPTRRVDDPVAVAQAAADAAQDLEGLRAAMASYEHCDLKRGARNLVFSDGVPGARVMIIGEAPGRDEDREGRPFVGRAGQLLDKMLGAIGLARDTSVYITNVLPWRPPQNRDPKAEETAMMRPFLNRHIALADPDVLVIVGNHACQALLGKRGIVRLRGDWTEAQGKPALPMFHPAYLLRTPTAKREAWADLLTLNAWLRDG
ncbi:MAG: uracil-DNA glycosylase [Pseudomonadota bacterium]